jgi:hypothetical protein
MKHLLWIFLIAPLFLPPVVLAQTAPGGGLEGTEHDFTEHNPSNPTPGSNTVDVGLCTFCHTPHRAYTTRLLWNHTLSAAAYTWNDATETTGGTPLPSFDATWQGVSKNCLSCHDGTVALGDVAWFAAAPRTGVDAILDHQHDDPNDPGRIAAGAAAGNMNGNHPVAFPYPLGNAISTYNSVTTGTNVITAEFIADPTSSGIRLFTDDGAGVIVAGTAAGQTGIECSSCHDPHNGSTVQGEYFLRGELEGSGPNYICLKCHDK